MLRSTAEAVPDVLPLDDELCITLVVVPVIGIRGETLLLVQAAIVSTAHSDTADRGNRRMRLMIV